MNCKHLLLLDLKPSSFKGYHFLLLCDKKCDICRIVYDDFRRLAYDLNRPYYARNILFDDEIYPMKEKEPKWLTPEMKKRFNVWIKRVNGVRITKLISKREK